jgi:hypothetical protein
MSEKCDSCFVSLVMLCRLWKKYISSYAYARKWLDELSGLNACFCENYDK